jgi:hypothetical protein
MQLIENGSGTLEIATSGLDALPGDKTARVLDLPGLSVSAGLIAMENARKDGPPLIPRSPTEHVHELIRAENCVAQ